MELRLRETDKAKLVGSVIEYNELPYAGNSKVILDFIFPQDSKITDFLLTPTCGCTITNTWKNTDGSYYTDVKYDTKRVGEFEKTVKISYKENGKNNSGTFKIKGKVRENGL